MLHSLLLDIHYNQEVSKQAQSKSTCLKQIQKFELHKRDVLIDKEKGKTAVCISKVVQEQEQFAGLKNRREPYNIAMYKALHKKHNYNTNTVKNLLVVIGFY